MDIDNCITSQCTGTGYTTFAAKNTEESKKESKVKFKQQESHISSSICTHYNQLLYFLIFAGVIQSFDVDDETQTNHKFSSYSKGKVRQSLSLLQFCLAH